MLVCPLIGVYMVNLTTWRLRSKILVGLVGSIFWIGAVGLVIFSHRATPI